MDTELKDLIGKKVNKIYYNSQFLKFKTDGGDFTFTVSGDCCSYSYFFDFYGVKNLLENGEILKIERVDLDPTDLKVKKQYADEIAVYGYRITTYSENYGEVSSVFSFRNSSNGYYGGSLDACDNRKVSPEIKDDVVEAKNNE